MLGLALVILGAGTLCAADSKEFVRRKAPPKKTTGLTFAEPDAPRVNTNVPNITTPKPGLDALDDTIRKPFEIFKVEDSLNGVFAPPVRRPPPPPMVKNKRAEAKRERQKNWVFTTEEEIYGLPTAEEIMDLPEFGPDGELKKPRTSLERYLERLENRNSASSTNQAGSDKLPPWMKAGEPDDKTGEGPDGRKSADGPGQSTSVLSSLTTESKRSAGFDFDTTAGNAAAAAAGSGRAGWFSFSSSGTSDKPAARDAASEERMQKFKQMLEPRSLAGPSWSVTPFASGAYGGSYFDSRPVSRPFTLPSVTPVAATPSYFTPSIPLMTPPVTRTPMPSSSFELPKRKY